MISAATRRAFVCTPCSERNAKEFQEFAFLVNGSGFRVMPLQCKIRERVSGVCGFMVLGFTVWDAPRSARITKEFQEFVSCGFRV